MKNNYLIAILFLLAVSTLSKAQAISELTSDQKKFLINSWYESPRESKGNIVTFRLERHEFESGVDMVGYENSEIVVKKDQEFNVTLWKWCPNNNEVSTGKWMLSGNTVSLDFSSKTCQCEVKILELEKNKLKIEINRK